MSIEQRDIDERQERVDRMVEEFRAARQRRLVKRGKTLWNRTEGEQQSLGLAVSVEADLPPSKVN